MFKHFYLMQYEMMIIIINNLSYTIYINNNFTIVTLPWNNIQIYIILGTIILIAMKILIIIPCGLFSFRFDRRLRNSVVRICEGSRSRIDLEYGPVYKWIDNFYRMTIIHRIKQTMGTEWGMIGGGEWSILWEGNTTTMKICRPENTTVGTFSCG